MSVREGFNPKTLREALEILDWLKGEKLGIIAGGTDFMVKLKEHKMDINYLIDITGIDELAHVTEENNHLFIGPLITHDQAISHTLIRKYAPVISEGCAKVGSPQIRYRGTLGGNVCTGSPAGDSLPPMAILGARFTLSGLAEERKVSFEDFFLGPQKTDIRPGELLTGIQVEKMGSREKFSFEWAGMRKALTVTKASIAMRCSIENGRISHVKIAMGSVAPKVVRAYNAEKELENVLLNNKAINLAVGAIRMDAHPIDDVRSTGPYRKHLVGILLKRSLERFMSGAETTK